MHNRVVSEFAGALLDAGYVPVACKTGMLDAGHDLRHPIKLLQSTGTSSRREIWFGAGITRTAPASRSPERSVSSVPVPCSVLSVPVAVSCVAAGSVAVPAAPVYVPLPATSVPVRVSDAVVLGVSAAELESKSEFRAVRTGLHREAIGRAKRRAGIWM